MKTQFPQVFQHGKPIKNILEEIQDHRTTNGFAELNPDSIALFGEAIRVVFIQARDHLKNTQLSHKNNQTLNMAFHEIAKSISAFDEVFNNKYQNTLFDFEKHNCPFFQTSSLYKLIFSQFIEYNQKLISEKCTKTYSELYFLISLWVLDNAHIADFFYKQLSFRCLEMVVRTLKGGY
ncbi:MULTISPECIES: hypothetical protein [Acinetobacter]|uniref:Uncharacterized protein n=1 Tax=Acinetobacter indicus TaxID=756892 RepID=A0A6C0Y7H5_9GAMM|nr:MULTISPECIES: hypothetical protein [Acinetobacter]QIC71822.1 hypothetical protein FSC09_15645 [Acinetobacter indicus]QKQ71358.1 hypothetical protein E5Y90_14095 [Acinetobacter sp. 10FS3-1]